MEKNNFSKDIQEDYQDFMEVMEELKKRRTGNLEETSLEAKNIDFIDSDEHFSTLKSGPLNKEFIQSHDINVQDFLSVSSTKKIRKEYYTKHESSLDEHDIGITDKQEPEKEDPEARIPYDYVVKTFFLQKRIVRCCGGTVFLYNGNLGCFQEQTEASLHVAIRKSLTPEMDMRLTKNKLIDVVHRIISSPELQVKHEDFDTHANLINFRNCVFDSISAKSFPHSPDYMFTSFIDATYGEINSGIRVYINGNPSGSGYYFQKFLRDCTNDDVLKIKSLQQLTGYIISNEWRAKKFFVLVGLPHTGKSVWLSLWRSLIGAEHTTAMSLKQLGETRFMTAELFRSKLNITAEMDENGAIKGTDIIKMITGGDLITAEKKGKDPFQFYGKTKLVAAGNHMPLLNKLDGTSAFTDRILFLMFNNMIHEEKRDKSLMDKLLGEKSHIIEWALEGLQELRNNGLVFTESDDAKAFKAQYLTELNNVPEFIRDYCIVDLNRNDLRVHRRTLYPIYTDYCRNNGVRSLSKEEFYTEVKKIGVISAKFRIGKSSPLWGFLGLGLLKKTEESY